MIYATPDQSSLPPLGVGICRVYDHVVLPDSLLVQGKGYTSSASEICVECAECVCVCVLLHCAMR